MKDNKTIYEERVQNRTVVRYLLGLFTRWKMNLKYEKARKVALKNGAQVGEGVVMPLSLAKRLNSNCVIGNHVSIQSDKIDTRSPLYIGNNVIIGANVEILTGSHDIDSEEWEYKQYGLTIEDYVWIATGATILPSCRKLAYGSVVGGASLVYKDTESMDVISGNPAKVIRKRKCVHSNLVVESLLGGDYYIYKKIWHERSK